MGPVPVWYWPKYETDLDDLDPVLRMFTFRNNNYFGNQVLLDFNGFRLLNLRRPGWIDLWNIDVDYLSRRGPALGTEFGWFGTDPVRDLTDPYHYNKRYTGPGFLTDYFGYLDNCYKVDGAAVAHYIDTFVTKKPFVFGVLVNPNRPGVEANSRELDAAAHALGRQLIFQNAGPENPLEELSRPGVRRLGGTQ